MISTTQARLLALCALAVLGSEACARAGEPAAAAPVATTVVLPPATTGAAPPAVRVDSPAPSAAPSTPAAPSPRTPTRVVLERTATIPVGKWPESVLVSGGSAWVADSGDRRVTRVDLATNKVIARIAAGRLPVHLGAGPDGKIYTVAVTDSAVYVIDPAVNRGRLLTHLPNYPEHMVYADGALWVLCWKNGSSADSEVVRVDLPSGRLTRSEPLGRSARTLALGHGHVWVARADEGVTVVDPRTLKRTGELKPAKNVQLIAAGPTAMYASAGSSVLKLDPTSGAELARVTLAEAPSVLRLLDGALIAATRGGTLYSLELDSLELRSELRLAGPSVELHDVATHDGALLVTDHAAAALLVVRPRP